MSFVLVLTCQLPLTSTDGFDQLVSFLHCPLSLSRFAIEYEKNRECQESNLGQLGREAQMLPLSNAVRTCCVVVSTPLLCKANTLLTLKHGLENNLFLLVSLSF